MRRGTRVGQAYVALAIDGDGMNDAILDEFDDIDFREIGDRHGEKYREGFEKHLTNFDDSTEKALKNAARVIESDETLTKGARLSLANAFDNGRLDDLILHAGQKAGHSWGDGFEREVTGGVLDALDDIFVKAAKNNSNLDLTSIFRNASATSGENGMASLGPDFDRIVERVKQAVAERVRQEKMGDEIVAAMHQRYEKEYARLLDERDMRIAESEKANADLAKKFAEARVRIAEDTAKKIILSDEKLIENQQALYNKAAKDFDKRNSEQTKAILAEGEKRLRESKNILDGLAADEEAMWKVRRATAKAYTKYLSDLERGRIDEFGNAIERAARRSEMRLSNLLGRVTGKGSRSNFLNFIGSAVANAVGLFENLGRSVLSLRDKFSAAFSAAGGGPTGVIKGLGAVFSSLSSNVYTLAAALAVLVVAIGPVVAAFSLLLGTITALAATLSYAAVGALAAFGAALTPVVFAVGTATLAYQGLDKAQRRVLKNDFSPLVKQAKDLRAAVAGNFFGNFDAKGVSGNLTSGLKTVQPLLVSIAAAVADVAERFSQVADSAAFRMFVTAMQRVLPDAIRNIGDGLAGFAEGFLGVMRALAPTISSVAQSIGDAGERFAAWANSRAGQQSLTQFFADAAESLGVVKDFLGEIGGLLGDLFTGGGKDAGDNLFRSMTDAVESFRKSIRNGEIERWFKDSIDFAKSLGRAFVGIMKVVDALDNEFTRAFATTYLNYFMLSMQALATATRVVEKVLLAAGIALTLAAEGIAAIIGEVGAAIVEIAADVLGVLATLVETVAKIPKVGDAFDGVAESLRNGQQNVLNFADSVRELGGTRDKLAGLRSGLIDISKGISPGDLKKVDLLREKIAAIPNKKITQLVADGTEKSMGQIRRLAERYALTPKEIRTLTRVLGDDDAKRRIDDLIRKAKEFDALRPQPEMKIRDLASASIQRAIDLLNIFDRDRSNTITTTYRRVGADPDGIPYPKSSPPPASPGGGGSSERTTSGDTADAVMLDTPGTASRASTSGGSDNAEKAKETAKKAREAARALSQAMRAISKALRDVSKAGKADSLGDVKSLLGGFASTLRGNAKDGKIGKNSLITALGVIGEQKDVNKKFIDRLLAGKRVERATLADYAVARARLAKQIDNANEKLKAALDLRNSYNQSVADSVRDFGALTTAEASVVDGIKQSLTATDITTNLQARLDKIRKFQENLRILVAQGLSNDAYKQLVDAGVDGGSAYVDALVAGGAGAITQVNGLVSEIGSVADSLGLETSSRLYQAGVDAAQGLVDGLESMSERIDNAGAKLGASIARAIARALGIDPDGKKGGGGKKGNDDPSKSSRSVAPRVESTPQAAFRSAPAPVSGNSNDIDITVVTPTEDPHAVATEVMNEMVARL